MKLPKRITRHDIAVFRHVGGRHIGKRQYRERERFMGAKNSRSEATLSPVAFHILLCLADTNLHGYGIKLEIEKRTEGAMNLGSGTLYEAIQRLESARLLATAATPADAPSGARKRRYYRLLKRGRRVLEHELARMDKVVRYAKRKKLLPEAR